MINYINFTLYIKSINYNNNTNKKLKPLKLKVIYYSQLKKKKNNYKN